MEMTEKTKKDLAKVIIQTTHHLITIVPGNEGVRNGFDILYAPNRCVWIFTDKVVTDVVPFESIEFIHFTWKPKEPVPIEVSMEQSEIKDCPTCKGTGVTYEEPQFEGSMPIVDGPCLDCNGTGKVK